MLVPERMRRILILAERDDAPRLIDTLHDARVAHIIEHRVGDDDLDIGRPLPHGSAASERLVRVRSLLRHLDAEGHRPTRVFTASAIDDGIDQALDDIEAAVSRTVDARADAEAELSELQAQTKALEPLAKLPLLLEDYRGYEHVAVLVGTVESDPRKDVGDAAHHLVESFYDARARTVAVFAAADQREAVQNALLRHGFKEMEVPHGQGRPEDRARAIGGEVQALSARIAETDAHLKRLRADHADFLRAAEEHLTFAVEKAEAPLAWGATEYSFVLEAWVPDRDLPSLEARVHEALGDRVHMETIPEAPHAHEGGHGVDDIQGEAGPGAAETEDVPPTKLANGGFSRQFEYFTHMFSTPRYGEVDPTAVLALFFPLFFGFMIGDLGLGLLMVGLGVLMVRKLGRVEGLRELGFAIAIAGVVAAIIGGVVFADAFGIPLGFTHHMEEELEHAHLALACTPAVYQALHEANWGCLLTGQVWHVEPLLIKTLAVQEMILISIVAGLVHLSLGLAFGIRNELHHDKRHAAAKVGWLVLLLAFFVLSMWLLARDTLAAYVDPGVAAQGAGVGVAVAAVVLLITEGGLAIIELPSMLSNLLSYLRLGAVAIAKGAMAIAFNNLTLVAALGGTGLVVALGLLGFLVAQVVLFVLGLLSSGIQAIRLNYVEFFTKFYKGGGKPFRPFGHVREFTTEN